MNNIVGKFSTKEYFHSKWDDNYIINLYQVFVHREFLLAWTYFLSSIAFNLCSYIYEINKTDFSPKIHINVCINVPNFVLLHCVRKSTSDKNHHRKNLWHITLKATSKMSLAYENVPFRNQFDSTWSNIMLCMNITIAWSRFYNRRPDYHHWAPNY